MTRYLPLLLLPLLAACQVPELDEAGNPIPPPPPPLPDYVRAAMPPGMPDVFVFQLSNGCWGVGIEASEPRSGRPLRDGAGNWVCDPGVTAPDLVAAAEEPSPAG